MLLRAKNGSFSYPSLAWLMPSSGGTRHNFWMKFTAQKLNGWGYSKVKIHNPIFNRF